MKKYYTKISSKFIFKLMRVYKNTLEEINDEILDKFDTIEELKNYQSTYSSYTENKSTIDLLNNILEKQDEVDLILINE